ncbi:2-oxo acid dehydrogenase subunit E2 [bacterium]|nr:2-oxo acid dehydrogenase subunit E2 [bacterium]
MIREIIMPKLGETMEEGYLVSWKKEEGEKVEKGEVLFEVMSDKTNFEVESPYSGYLRKKLYEPSDEPIKVTTVIGYISDTPNEPLPEIKEEKVEVKEEKKIEKEEVKKEETKEQEKEDRIKITPLARKIASEHNLDITKIKGSGPGGRIEKKDVEKYLESIKETEEISYEVKEWTPLRKIIAKNLVESKNTIPHFYLQGKFNMDNLIKIKETLEKEGRKYTFTDFLIFITSRVMKDFPLINASIEKDEIRIYKSIDIALAIAIEDGLIVPVIRNCDRKTIDEISEKRKELIAKAKENKLSEENLKDARFVISNLGMFDVDSFFAIINPPGVAIMAVGKIEKVPVVVNNEIQICSMMNISFSFDHRIIDGTYGASFYKKLKQKIENPGLLLFEK